MGAIAATLLLALAATVIAFAAFGGLGAQAGQGSQGPLVVLSRAPSTVGNPVVRNVGPLTKDEMAAALEAAKLSS